MCYDQALETGAVDLTERLGKYVLETRLGTGGMAEVFLATNVGPEGFRRSVAIKKIHPHLGENEDFVTMFLDEARLAARFNHPNLVQIYELGQEDETYFLAMEYVDGASLAKLQEACREQGTSLPLDYVIWVVSQVCAGLDYAQDFKESDGTPLNLVHRDVSPQNIMLSYDGVVKLLDFGIAKAASNVYKTRSGVMKGKISYLSPEQVRGHKGLDRRTDVFSLGVVLYELVSGERPFHHDNDAELMRAIVHSQPLDPRAHAPDLPDAVIAIINRALQKDREKRFATAGEMRDALEQTLLERGVVVGNYTLASFLESVIPTGTASDDVAEAVSATAGVSDGETPAERPHDTSPDDETEVQEGGAARPDVSAQEETATTPAVPESAPAPSAKDAEEDARRAEPASSGEFSTLPLGLGEPIAGRRGGRGLAARIRLMDLRVQLGLLLLTVLTAGILLALVWAVLGPGESPVVRGEKSEAVAEPGSRSDGVAPTASAAVPVPEPARAPRDEEGEERPGAAPRDPERSAAPPPSTLLPSSRPAAAGKRPRSRHRNGSLTVRSQPKAELFVDGKSFGTTPREMPIILKPGPHLIELRNAEHGIRYSDRLRISPAERRMVNKVFRRGYLRVFVKPFGALFVDGQSRGLTPLKDPIELYEGRHTVRAFCSDTGKEETRIVVIRPEEVVTTNIDLR